MVGGLGGVGGPGGPRAGPGGLGGPARLARPAGRPAGRFVHFFCMKITKNDIKIKESISGTSIFESSVKFRFEWYQFRRIKPKP